MNKESIIGESIICSGLGIGQITDITHLTEGGEEFYKVNFPKDKCTNYFSIENKKNYRILSSKKTLSKAIETFKTSFEPAEYKTVQEKINTVKELLKEEDVVKLAKTLSQLNAEKELHVQINKSYKDTLDSFIDEISFVLEVKRSEAYSILSLKDPDNKK